jgi:3-oxoacyl-[acyl-carrier protein] reductase
MKLKEKVALVTGSAGAGIGYAIAQSFAIEGARIIVVDRHDSRTKAAADRIAVDCGVDAIGIRCDVTGRRDVEKAVALSLATFGRIDILVNNAGTNRPSRVVDMTDDAWELVINTSLRGTFYFCRAALPAMMEQRSGRIINIASTAAFQGLGAGHSHYAAAKAGVIAYTRCLAMEVAEFYVTANTIAPGFIPNEFVPRLYPEAEIRRMEAAIPYPRKGTPDDIAKAALFLATDGEYITGQTLCVNGGSWMR